METVFATTYANLNMGNHEIKALILLSQITTLK